MIAAAARFLKARVARRLFLFFVLSAFLPLAAIAVMSLAQVRDLLLEQGEQRLAAIAKGYGMSLFERLLVAADVALSAASRSGRGLSEDGLAKRTFRSLAFLDAAGVVTPVFGTAPSLPLSEEAQRRLAAGKPVVLVDDRAGPARVLLAASPSAPSPHRVVFGELNPPFLWGDSDERPVATQFCVVEDRTRIALHCTAAFDPGIWNAVAAATRSSLGTASWARNGETYRGTAWPQFMGAGFGTPDWVVIASQPERFQLVRAVEFRELYIPVVLLALLLVTWLTIRQARNIVTPVARLAERARGVTRNDFHSRVKLARDDEFGELATAFDQMSERLGRQFDSLTALSEIDRLILSTVDTSQVVGSVLERLRSAIPADVVAVTLFDHDNPDHARTYLRADALGELTMARHDVSASEREALEAHGSGRWTTLASPDSYLAPVAAHGASNAYVQPILWRGAVCGVLALGYRTGASPTDDERQQIRELADRVAVAVSSAWRDEQLYVQAHFDLLTALPNRLLFMDRLGQEISRSERERLRFAILFIDLDRFKGVNDSFGHPAGDTVLRETARRISGCLRSTDTVSRLGGDEFTAMLTNLNQPQEALLVAETLVEALSKVFDADGNQCFLSASVGIASYPEDGASAEDLMKKADTAMYRAKAAGRAQVVFFEERMNADAVARLTLDRDLRMAIERGELELHYQPLIEVRTGTVIGAEALVRWRHPQLGLVSPVRFIPLAEESGFIEQIGNWTLRQACAQIKAWRSEGLALQRVAVNVSPRQFRRRGLIEFIRRSVAQAGLPPSCIEIEVTEGVLVERGEAAEELLGQLNAMGHSISLDDFGTGFSSMAYLMRFPVHTLKIDRVFIDGLERRADSEAIVGAIIAMAHALGKSVTAEGVETRKQYDLLSAMGCDLVQGFLFSPALPAGQFESFVRSRVTGAAVA